MSNITLFGKGVSREIEQTPRATRRALEQVHGHGLIAAEQIRATEYATGVALSAIGYLSMQEAVIVQQVPHAEGRAKAIVDNFTAVAAGTIARMGYRS